MGIQFLKLRMNLIGKPVLNQTTGGTSIGKLRVPPEMGEHLQQVRLAAAEEAADPRRVLFRGPEVRKIAIEDAQQRLAELPVADEHLELGPQLVQSRRVPGFHNARLSVVGEPRSARVAVEHVVDIHKTGPPPCSVTPWAR